MHEDEEWIPLVRGGGGATSVGTHSSLFSGHNDDLAKMQKKPPLDTGSLLHFGY